MSKTETIPKELLERNRRYLKRMIVSVICEGMAESDMGSAEIAAALGKKTREVAKWIRKMLDGTTTEFDALSDLCTALGREPIFFFDDPVDEPQVFLFAPEPSHEPPPMYDADTMPVTVAED